MKKNGEHNYYPSLCVTHKCNLSCIYCYQHRFDDKCMSWEIAKESVDWIFTNIPSDATGMVIGCIGGEPLIEFELLKNIHQYAYSKNSPIPFTLFATTNGTLLTADMKKWFANHRDTFKLGLSLDGSKETHDHNRSGSFDQIDINFFLSNWPSQGVKMTLSEYSLLNLANDIKFLHNFGFKRINGVNLFEGIFNWDKDEYISLVAPQLKELVEYYIENGHLQNQMFDKHIYMCEQRSASKKWCGIGANMQFIDVDGERYPCAFVTPMTFTSQDIFEISTTDFSCCDNFIDSSCFNDCYLYPICPTCSGANYLLSKSFKIRNKSKCRILKIIALFLADLHAKRLVKSSGKIDPRVIYYTIASIKKIRSLYFEEFEAYI